MAINHAEIMEMLDKAVADTENERGQAEFPYAFLNAFALPKSTITQLRNGKPRNIAEREGDIGLKSKFYFHPVDPGQSLNEATERLMESRITAQHDTRFIVVTDFRQLVAYDRSADDWIDTPLKDLSKKYSFFLPLAGHKKAEDYEEATADTKAAHRLGKLFDQLREINSFEGEGEIHSLNVFLARLLFCYFAEDTGIFDPNQFTKTIEETTDESGSDTAERLTEVFRVMDLPGNAPERAELPTHLAEFPYVNGGLFEHHYVVPEFNAYARNELIRAGRLEWREINPDIFGSMFQAVIEEGQRSHLGQHYTSVPNILKTITPLFLDPLREELDAARGNVKRLEALHRRLQKLKLADFAAGTGNFLIIAYKRLRAIEMDILEEIKAAKPAPSNGMDAMLVGSTSIQLKQFYGVEVDDFPAEIARLSLWIAEHQMNQAFRERFGDVTAPLPLKEGGNIHCANALHLDWEKVVNLQPGDKVYVIGNPPFLGRGKRSDDQAEDMAAVFSGMPKHKNLDFVACWFWKGAHLIHEAEQRGAHAELALLTTNSINQGNQVALLWPAILDLGIKIRFAHQGFKWSNQARGQAGVYVSVIGLTAKKEFKRRLFTKTEKGWQESNPGNINPYLLAGNDIVIKERRVPTGNKAMYFGNMPNDGGNLILSTAEKEDLVRREPESEKWIRQLVGSNEFLKGTKRWALWLVGASTEEIEAMPLVSERVQRVREAREESNRASTRSLAHTPHLFGEIRQDEGDYILVPQVTSERREYAPIGFYGPDVIATNLVNIIPGGTLYDFGVLQTRMHMLWLATVGGRLKSDFRYSAKLVYNTFPWPEPTAAQREEIEARAQDVLDARYLNVDLTMAQMYDPDKMPEDLRQAHRALDEVVEQAYRPTPFRNDNERLEYLFKRYETLIAQQAASA